MPLLFTKNENNLFRYGIWHNTEDDRYFLDRMQLSDEEHVELTFLRARKRSEWLCSRYLLYVVAGHPFRGSCLKDEFGKPFIEGSDELISISHTFDYTGVILSRSVCGIDIQVITPKIIAVGPRFINDREFKFIPENNKLDYFHVIWGAKEAMYKCYGKKALDFRKHLHVHPFDFDPLGCKIEGMLQKNGLQKNYHIYSELKNDIILVYAIEKK